MKIITDKELADLIGEQSHGDVPMHPNGSTRLRPTGHSVTDLAELATNYRRCRKNRDV